MSAISDSMEMTGKLEIFKNGELVREIDNLVVTVGKNFVASRMVGVASNVMSHMAVGTGATAPAIGDTTLQTELNRQGLGSSSAAGAVASYSATFAAGQGTGALTEAGIFNASSAGVMLCRTTFATVNKGASDAITINWTVTVG